MLLIETDLDRFNEADWQAMLDELPTAWHTRILRKKPSKSRLQSAIGYALLKQLLEQHYGMTTFPSIAVDEHGKPYFENCELYFSISHCNTAIACIVEEYPVAIDVQDLLTDISPALAARIAAPLDPSSMTAQELTALWTQKEASAKLDGRGLSIGLEHLPLKEHTLSVTEHTSYILTIANNRVKR